MAPHDPLIYGAHVLFWLIFAAGNFHARRLSRTTAASPAVPGGEGQPPLRARLAPAGDGDGRRPVER